MTDGRECLVGVRGGVAMSGEVFCHRLHAAFLQAARVGNHMLRHSVGIFTKRAVSDHRIGRVGVDVGVGCEIHLYAHSSELPCAFASVVVYQVIVVCSAQCHIVREAGSAGYAHRKAPFAVEGYDERYSCYTLRVVDHVDILFD